MLKSKVKPRKRATSKPRIKVVEKDVTPVVTDKDRIAMAQKQAKERQMIIDELIQINAELTLSVARYRATLKVYSAQQQKPAGD